MRQSVGKSADSGGIEGPGRIRAPAREEYVRQIQFVAQQLGNANVSELERVATALFVELDPKVKPEDRPERLVSLKPHISRQDAPNAFERLEKIRSAALSAGVPVLGSKVETARG